MEARDNIKVKSLKPYRHLFPQSTGIDHVIKKGATVEDTVMFMPKAAQLSRWMVRNYVNKELRGMSRYEACKKLWHFVKEHIAYEKDDKNYQKEKDIRENLEQVKSARRLIADGKGDCDCMTNFVNTCMLELGVKGIINRITAYDYNTFFQHIYSLIPDGKGGYIIMDCVWNEFNKEKEYTNKKDYKMELQFLDGTNSNEDIEGTAERRYSNIDAQDVYKNNEDFGELGKLLKKRSPEKKQQVKEKRKAVVQKTKKVFNKVNKVNPATALLRAGILASMKLNVLKVPESIRWGYASREYAQSRGMDMSKYDRVKSVLQRTENIFYMAGGKPENLRTAILKGRGNRNNEVAGNDGLSETMSLSDLLGELYSDEIINGMEGFEGFGSLEGGEGLGEPATATSVTAASTTMATIAALLKQIGPLFPKNDKAPKKLFAKRKTNGGGGEDNSASQETPSEEETAPTQEIPSEETTTTSNNETDNSETPSSDGTEQTNEQPQEENPDNLPAESTSTELTTTDETNLPAEQNSESTEGLAGIGTKLKTFYVANKKWIKPVGISIGVGTVVFLIYKFSKDDKPKKEEKNDAFEKSVEGIKEHKKKRKRKYDYPKNSKGKTVIYLK